MPETIKIIGAIVLIALIVTFLIFVFLYWLINHEIEKGKKKKTKILAELSANPDKYKIVFLGDSLTDFYPLDQFFHNIDIYNRGVAGDTTDNILNRLNGTVYPLFPKTIFLQIGTNDLMERKSVEYIFNNIKKIVNELQTNIPNVKINIISLYPVNSKAFFGSLLFVGPRKNKDIVSINDLLKTYTKENNLTYIDVHSSLLDEKNVLNKKYTVEGLHISYDGYIVITQILKDYVEEATK